MIDRSERDFAMTRARVMEIRILMNCGWRYIHFDPDLI